MPKVKSSTRGGARPGAGRPRKPPTVVAPGADALAYLRALMRNEQAREDLRLRAAIALGNLTVAKPSRTAAKLGKKATALEEALEAAESGPFKARPAPARLLTVVGSRRRDEG